MHSALLGVLSGTLAGNGVADGGVGTVVELSVAASLPSPVSAAPPDTQPSRQSASGASDGIRAVIDIDHDDQQPSGRSAFRAFSSRFRALAALAYQRVRQMLDQCAIGWIDDSAPSGFTDIRGIQLEWRPAGGGRAGL